MIAERDLKKAKKKEFTKIEDPELKETRGLAE